jgi:hypothetical protein
VLKGFENSILIFFFNYRREQMDEKNQEAKDVRSQVVGRWIAIGLAIGAGVGVALDNIAIGVGIGLAIGAAIGAAQARMLDKE